MPSVVTLNAAIGATALGRILLVSAAAYRSGMHASDAIRELIEQMPNFFRLTYKLTVGRGDETETREFTQEDIAGHVASTLMSKLGTKGCLVVELSVVEVDEYGSRTARVPIAGQAWAYGEVRIDEGRDQLVIVDVPCRLAVDDAPALASALLAAHAAARPYRSPWGDVPPK